MMWIRIQKCYLLCTNRYILKNNNLITVTKGFKYEIETYSWEINLLENFPKVIRDDGDKVFLHGHYPAVDTIEYILQYIGLANYYKIYITIKYTDKVRR